MPEPKPDFTAAGLMSGTSLDGLDIAVCNFRPVEDGWKFMIDSARTIPYSSEWRDRLQNAASLDGFGLMKLNNDFGRYCGILVKSFLEEKGLEAELISSHGHTVFHQPQNHLTLQVGSGAEIAAVTGITTVCDFRSADVALGGQGAPLVPAGDELLFGKYDFCLNLGGFSNISYREKGRRIAFDVCPVNIVLNHYTRLNGIDFDRDGIFASRGNLNQNLLEELDSVPFYQEKGPKSLGREWVENVIFPLIDKYDLSLEDQLRTMVEHIAHQLTKLVIDAKGKDCGKKLIYTTGGGAFNRFLIERFSAGMEDHVIVPDKKIVEFKEALIFAFLGVLRIMNKINCLSSVTGAKFDHTGGAVYQVKALHNNNFQ